MQASGTVTELLKRWLYDWNGANVDLFLAIHRALPDGWSWLPELLSWIGSYWGTPAVVGGLLLWRFAAGNAVSRRVEVSLSKFVLGLALSLSASAIAKAAFALPRPFMALGEAVYRAAAAPDSLYTLPSGHATYIGVLVATLWPLLDGASRTGLLLFAAVVGWSRIALGAHFPADVIAGYLLGWACVAAAGPAARRIAPKLASTGATG